MAKADAELKAKVDAEAKAKADQEEKERQEALLLATIVQNSERQLMEEEEKREGVATNFDDKNSDYEQDPFDVEPVGKDGKTTGSVSQKTVNVNLASKSQYGTSVFESSEADSPSKPEQK